MVVTHATGQYEILFQPAILPDGIVVTDRNVVAAMPTLIGDRERIILEPGEQTKSFENYRELCRELVQRGATRRTNLIALGGGVIGDLVGFVAATYMRGIRYIQIPTTLLAQVDSSVGGKTGIDLPEGKNLVGAFYPPSEVQIDITLLRTLPSRQFRCGMAEVIKYGFIQSPTLAHSLLSQPLTLEDERLGSVVEECIAIKARMVAEDEFETLGIRAQLNYGHTVGHALEQVTSYDRYTHGEAIAIGMVAECRIGEALGLTEKGLHEEVERLMMDHGLPVRAVELNDIERIIGAMRNDKKSARGELSMSLIESVGKCRLVHDIDEQVVRGILHECGKS